MAPVESTSPCLVRFLSDGSTYPRPRYATKGATAVFAGSVAAAAPMGLSGAVLPAMVTILLGGAAAAYMGYRGELNVAAGERRHRAACAVRERMRSMMTMRTLHRALNQALIDMLDEGAKQYLLARGHASKVAHPLTAQADAAAVCAMDDLLLEIGLSLPHRVAPRTLGDALNDAFVVRPVGTRGGGSFGGLGMNFGRFLGATPPPEPDYDAMRRLRPHVQALADLAAEIERTLPALVQTMDLPAGAPPVSKTLDALREHREARESLERELRLGG